MDLVEEVVLLRGGEMAVWRGAPQVQGGHPEDSFPEWEASNWGLSATAETRVL